MATSNVEFMTRIENHDVKAVIEEGCEFEGKLSFEGTVRIGGKFKGTIFTKDVLIIGEGAYIEGEIQAGTVILSGHVTADITARNRVEIHRPAVFRGNIVTPSLMVAEGVIFEGSSKMLTQKPDEQKSFFK